MVGSLIAGIAGAGASVLGTIGGAIGSAIKNKQAEKMLNEQRDENRAWYESKKAEDYTQRSDAQAVINKQRELLNEQYKNARATNVVAGGSDESLAMQKQAANASLNETMSGIASNASNYKDSLESQYRQQDAALNQQQIALKQQQAQNIANAGAQLGKAGASVGTSALTQWAKSQGANS